MPGSPPSPSPPPRPHSLSRACDFRTAPSILVAIPIPHESQRSHTYVDRTFDKETTSATPRLARTGLINKDGKEKERVTRAAQQAKQESRRCFFPTDVTSNQRLPTNNRTTPSTQSSLFARLSSSSSSTSSNHPAPSPQAIYRHREPTSIDAAARDLFERSEEKRANLQVAAASDSPLASTAHLNLLH